MSNKAVRPLTWLLSLVASVLCAAPPAGFSREILPPGFRPRPLGVHALVGGKVVIRPGQSLDGATIVIRDGYIEAVGNPVTPPADARIWDMKGLTIYAGFLEPYLPLGATNPPISTSDSEPVTSATFASGGANFFGVPGQKTDQGQRGPGYGVGKVVPETRMARSYSPDKKIIASLRELGFTAAVIAPTRGIVRGTSALVALAEADPNELVVKPDVFQHIAFETDNDDDAPRAYPVSLMGAIAVVRQSFFDAQHYVLDQADWQKHPQGRRRPEFDPSLEALAPAAEGKRRVLFEPGSALMVDRAARVARELKLEFAIVSCGQEWRRPDLAKDTGATFIVPLNFPKLPKWPSEEDWEQATLDQLRAWDWAAENPALLRQQNLEVALTTYGLKERKEFRRNLRLALDRGLTEADALAALTTVPAKLCGVEKQLGTIEPGKIANLTVVDGKGYFDPEARVREVWVDGRNFHVQPAKEPEKEAKKDNDKESKTKAEKERKEAELRELQKKRVARSPLEGRGPITNPPAVVLFGTVWTCGSEGLLTNAGIVIARGKIQKVGQNIAFQWPGPLLTPNLNDVHITPGLIDCHSHSAILGAVNESAVPSSAMCRIGDVVNSETKNLREQLAGGLTVANLLHGSANPIGGQNQVIKLRDGASPEGLKFEGALPGIKFALGENVKQSNWGEKFVTRYPQTRMGVPPFYVNRFTAARQYVKEWEEYKNGSASVPRAASDVPSETSSTLNQPSEAKKDGAARKSDESSAKTPKSATGTVALPHRNLELEAIGEIIQGRRLIHCHSYRQDEILAFLRTMESFGVKVATLQHVLEGYKVADEIAAHGAGASTFADWWAYKFEVYDAIPFNGSLMRERGVLVSFNSDSSDLARRLNTEAAKAVKYGGTPEIEALKFVTINPAKQLRIDDRVGSLEPGKDADFVVWSGNPLDSRSVVLQTWIDGKKYFDRDEAVKRAAALKQERADLIAKAKKIAKLSGGGADAGGGDDDGSFFRVALEHQFDGVDRGCLDEAGR
jgi:imidazolonepropionase-like amidohydrolase